MALYRVKSRPIPSGALETHHVPNAGGLRVNTMLSDHARPQSLHCDGSAHTLVWQFLCARFVFVCL
jgi:hypothetical protein